MTTGPHYNDLG